MLIKELITKRAGAAIMAVLFVGMTLMGCSGDLNPLNAPADENAFSVLELGELDDPTLATKPLVLKKNISAANGGELILTSTVRVNAARFAFTDAEKRRARGKKVDVTMQYKVVFPAGALDEDTEITMRAKNRGKIQVWLAPHGAQFNKPVQFSISLVSKQVSSRRMKHAVDIYWLDQGAGDGDDDEGEWVPLSAFITNDRGGITATVRLDHFSQYSLGGYGPIQKWYYQNWYYNY